MLFMVNLASSVNLIRANIGLQSYPILDGSKHSRWVERLGNLHRGGFYCYSAKLKLVLRPVYRWYSSQPS